MKRYRTGIIGLGRIGFLLQYDPLREQPASHTAAFGGNPGIELAGGFDIDAEKRTRWRKVAEPATAYESLDAMLSDGRWDILVVATNENRHLEVFRQAIAYKPRLIVMEKPIAPNLKDALEMQRLSIESLQDVAVNFERRFSADYLWAKSCVASGELGRLRFVTAKLFSKQKAWIAGDFEYARGSLMDDAPHLVDTIRFLTDSELTIDGVSSVSSGTAGDYSGIEAYGYIGEAAACIGVGYETQFFAFEIELSFEAGRIRIGNGILELWKAESSPYYQGFYSLKRDESVQLITKTGYFSGMVQNCVDFLDGKSTLRASLDDGVESIRVLEGIVRKLEKNG